MLIIQSTLIVWLTITQHHTDSPYLVYHQAAFSHDTIVSLSSSTHSSMNAQNGPDYFGNIFQKELSL